MIATGDDTVMGRIAALAMSTKNEPTPINKEIHHFILVISAIAMFLGVLFFFLNLLIGTPHIENLVFMVNPNRMPMGLICETPVLTLLTFTMLGTPQIGIIVANVPEGLLATVTVCLTLTAQRMHAKQVLVKNLEGVETLGSTTCICSDKTGTLTQNVMTAARVVYGGPRGFVVEDAPSSFTGGNTTYDRDAVGFRKLLRCAALCNVAAFNESSKWERAEDGETRKVDALTGEHVPVPFRGRVAQGDGSTIEKDNWEAVGNASECAMIKLVQGEACPSSGAGGVDDLRAAFPTRFTIPFNSKNKYREACRCVLFFLPSWDMIIYQSSS